MNLNKICIGCMQEIENKEQLKFCPYCGHELTNNKSAQHQLQPMTILKERYLIGKVIGEGGFGITYLGYNLNLEIQVAIKEFYPNGMVTRDSEKTSSIKVTSEDNAQNIDKWRNNFIEEARKLAKFTNLDGIVKVLDFFYENETAYIVMEYFQGITINKYLNQCGGMMSVTNTLSMMEPVILSLSKVHEIGIIHRDISPDNIIINSSGKVKLLDFGAARNVTSETNKSISIMLKPGYSPEEQYKTKGNQGTWTDVYALCATIYKCITGITPLDAMDRVTNDTLKRPGELGIKINPYQEEALMTGLSVYSENRIKNINALYNALYTSWSKPETVVEKSIAPIEKTIPKTNHTTKHINKKTTVKKKKGITKKLTAAWIALLCIIFITGSVAAAMYLINKNVLKEDKEALFTISGKMKKEDVEAEMQTDTQEDKTQYLTDMLQNKEYEALINEIMYGSIDELDEYKEEVNEILRQAIVGHQNQSIQKVDEMIANNNLLGVFDILNAEIVYREKLGSDGAPAEFVTTDELYNKSSDVMPLYEDYIYKAATEFANNGDTVSLENVFLEADKILSGDNYNHKKATIYGKLVAAKSLQIDISNGPQDAIDYINNNLYLTYNNGYCMELWDVFDHKRGGGAYDISMPNVKKNGYLLPGSNNRFISQTELVYLSRYEIYVALYEIYARHGRTFTDALLNDYFSKQSWYSGSIAPAEFDEMQLNEYEIQNINIIVNYRKAMGWFGY